MIRFYFILITLFALFTVLYKRANEERYRKVKKLIRGINGQYKNLFTKKNIYLSFYQWIIFFISQVVVIFAVISVFIKFIYKYAAEDYSIAIKVFTVIIVFIIVYFAMGYLLLTINNVYKYLYKIEDKNTKSDLLISYFIISMYMTILIVFPEQFGENYKIGLVGVTISYFLNLKVLLKIIRSPHVVNFKKENEKTQGISNIGVVAAILLTMVIISLSLAVCFISSSGEGVYTNNPTFFDLFYYTIITFATIGYGDISPISPVAKFMSIIISLTSILCLTIFVSSVLSYKKGD